jgi:hypothetical protein
MKVNMNPHARREKMRLHAVNEGVYRLLVTGEAVVAGFQAINASFLSIIISMVQKAKSPTNRPNTSENHAGIMMVKVS